MKITEPNKFVTAEMVDVTKRIEERKTYKFIRKSDADAFAAQKRSYVYDLYIFVNKEKEIEHYGYAVPN